MREYKMIHLLHLLMYSLLTFRFLFVYNLSSKRKIQFNAARGLTQPEAKKYMPPKCSLSKETNIDTRWRADAKWLVPARSKVYTRGGTTQEDDDALRWVLITTWKEYERKNLGGECPWDFGPMPLF